MICPKCKATLADGSLYCIHCGASIQIVPDYNPEIEDSLQMALCKINIDKLTTKQTEKKNNDKPLQFKIKRIVFVIVAISLIIFISFLYYGYTNTYSYLKFKTYEALQDKNYDNALMYLEKAMSKYPDDYELNYVLADLYNKVGESDKAVSIYVEMIEKDSSDLNVYKKLVSIYEKQERYEELRALLYQAEDENIKKYFASYYVYSPEFSIPEGAYEEELALKLMEQNQNSIYYTLDGSKPTTDSSKYETPIFLKEGITVVKAIAVNEKGFESGEVSATYKIEVENTPENISITIIPDSGTYDEAQNIMLNIPGEYQVYYTTDGTIPTKESKKYTGLIPMPLGSSQFKFAVFNEELRAGDVQVRDYFLTIIANYSEISAMDKVKSDLVSIAYLADLEGNVPGAVFQYIYENRGAFVNQERTYYMIEEYCKSTEEMVLSTNKYFAVDVITGESFYAQYDNQGNILLNPIIN